MENAFYQQLIDEYNNNCQFTEALAVNHVANIEIPVFNTLSSLSKSEFQEFIFRITPIIKTLSMVEQSLIFTILIEVLTGVIKQSDFFTTFDKNNDYIILTLSRKICTLNKPPIKDDMNLIRRNIDQMLKYSQQIDSTVLKDFLNIVQEKFMSQKSVVQKNSIIQHMTHSFDKLSVQCVDKNRNVDTKQTILKNVLQRNEQLRNKTEVSLDVKSTIVLKDNTDNSNVAVPQKRLPSAFDVMIQASSPKKKKL